MDKKEFISRLAAHGYTKKDCKKIIDDVVLTLMECMAEGETVRLHGFGDFVVTEMPERNIANPRTGEKMVAPPVKIAKFAPGMGLKRAVREGIVRQ